jgi:polysaccharide pyruvyl transferase WcaK-like protein
MHRRSFTHAALALGLSATQLPALAAKLKHKKQPVILWRNAWNINNIGDVGHVPGALALLRKYIPEAKIILWAHRDTVFRGEFAQKAKFADGMVDAASVSRKVIPDLEIVLGALDAHGKADNAALEAAVAQADIMVIGSGAGILASGDLMSFHQRTGKPLGMFGISTDPFNFFYITDGEKSTDTQALRAASFVFLRDKGSMRVLDGKDVDGAAGELQDDPATSVNETINRSAVTLDFSKVKRAFVPDTTFAFNVRDDAAAQKFMQEHGLVSHKFICVVPRHRWSVVDKPTPQGDSRVTYNNYYQRADCDKLKVAIIDYVRTTGNKVALVPETFYVVGEMLESIKNGLPDDVAKQVIVRKDFWLPDEAASLFSHSQAVVSIENHSPILAAAVGTPFVMIHQPEDSIKGNMFIDIGLGEWYIPNLNRASGAEISTVLMKIIRNPSAASAKLKKAMDLVQARHAFGMKALRRTLGLA